MPRRVIVLGAGASVHAGYPLAAKLGSSLKNWVDTRPADFEHHWGVNQLTKIYGSLDDFQTILTDLMPIGQGCNFERLGASRPYVLSSLIEALLRYFDSIRMAPTPLYDRLAKLLQDDDVAVTLNYDLAIERALRVAGKWDVSTGYGFWVGKPNASKVGVLKLHGSTNWRALLFEGRSGFFVGGSQSLGDRPVLYFRPDLEYLGYPAFVDPNCAGLTQAAVLPVMIMPAFGKKFSLSSTSGQEWKPFWEDLWRKAEIGLRVAEEIAIIGYSLPLTDERARDLLFQRANRDARLYVCCRQDTETIAQEFRNHGFLNIVKEVTSFEEYLDEAERRSN